MADLNWPEEQSTSFRYLWKKIVKSKFLIFFFFQFWVHEEHYENGKLVVSCKADITEVYSRETETYLVGEYTVGPDKALQAISQASSLPRSKSKKKIINLFNAKQRGVNLYANPEVYYKIDLFPYLVFPMKWGNKEDDSLS